MGGKVSLFTMLPPCHTTWPAVLISALPHRREQSQGHWTSLSVAVLDLGTATGIPQSRNYCHLAWVSDLEQEAGQHAVSRCQQTNHGQSYGSP